MSAWWDPKLSSDCPLFFLQQVSPFATLWYMPSPPPVLTPMFDLPGPIRGTSDILGTSICPGYDQFSDPTPQLEKATHGKYWEPISFCCAEAKRKQTWGRTVSTQARK